MDTKNKRILFIEDEEALRGAFGETFQRDGYTVFEASDGEDGMLIAKKELPDLILLCKPRAMAKLVLLLKKS